MAKTITKPVAKKAAAKKTVKLENPYLVTETVQRIAWEKIPNDTYIECTIGGTKFKGILVKEDGSMYIVHNNPRRDGSSPSSRRGFNYSWSIGREDEPDIPITNVTFPPMPEKVNASFPLVLEKISDYSVEVYKNHVIVGCTKVTKKRVEEILDAMNSFK